MTIQNFGELLENLKDSELFRYVQKYVCMSLANLDNPAAESHAMLDLVYAECKHRGKERLYDQAYESVCRKPDVCRTLAA